MKELPSPTFPLSPLALPKGFLDRIHTRHARVISAPAPQPERAELTVSWAKHNDEVRLAQHLRYKVFADEMGARLTTKVPGHDIDLFDNYCEHLLVRDAHTREVVGTYRVLTPAQAKRVGSTYSDLEFDLTRLRSMRERMVELGRSCVHKDYRHGGGGGDHGLVGSLGRVHGAQSARHHDWLCQHSHAAQRHREWRCRSQHLAAT